MNTYHLVKQIPGWVLKAEGTGKIILSDKNKQPLIDKLNFHFSFRKEIASVRIHDEWGKFQEERTYPKSADPFPPKG